MVYVDFIKEIKLQMTNYLGAKLSKEFSPWIWNEVGRGVEKTPKHMDLFRNILRINIDVIITEAEFHISKVKYLSFLTILGKLCHRHGEVFLASDLYEKVINLAGKESKYFKHLGDALLGQAVIYCEQAKFKDSKKLIRKAHASYYKAKDKAGEAECENILGVIDGEKGNLAGAQNHFENSLAIIKGKKALLLKSKFVNNLGIIHNIRGNYSEALKYFSQASLIFRELKMSSRYIHVRHNMAMLEMKNERYKSAIDGFLGCIKIAESEQYQPLLGIANTGISEAYFRLGKMKMAALHIDKARAISHRTNDRLTIADLYRVQGLIEKEKKNIGTAESLFLTSIRINYELKNRLNETEAREELGKLLFENDRKKEARKEIVGALKYYQRINFQSKVDELNSLLKNSR